MLAGGKFSYSEVSLRPPDQLNFLRMEKHQGQKDSVANQASRGSQAFPGILLSSSPLGEKPLLLLLPLFLPSMRADVCFPKSQAALSLLPIALTVPQEGRRRTGGAVSCAPTGMPVPGDQQ